MVLDVKPTSVLPCNIVGEDGNSAEYGGLLQFELKEHPEVDG